MPDFNVSNTLTDFGQAANAPEPKATAILQIDAEVMDWFQQQGPGWQADMSSVLRNYMLDIKAIDRQAPPEPEGFNL